MVIENTEKGHYAIWNCSLSEPEFTWESPVKTCPVTSKENKSKMWSDISVEWQGSLDQIQLYLCCISLN